jgi:hypothetical protein
MGQPKQPSRAMDALANSTRKAFKIKDADEEAARLEEEERKKKEEERKRRESSAAPEAQKALSNFFRGN